MVMTRFEICFEFTKRLVSHNKKSNTGIEKDGRHETSGRFETFKLILELKL